MSTARVDYIAPWWTYWLHNFPHVNLRFKPVDGSFNPQEDNYQQSLIFLVCVVAAGLGLNLLFLAIYLGCLCCCRSDEEEDEEETKRPKSCCVTWTAVIAGLICCVAVGVGFYGNSEMNDGVYQLTYSLYHANHTLNGVDTLVLGTVDSMQSSLKQHLARLDEIFAMRSDYIQILRFMQQMADNIILQLTSLPDWGQAKVDLARIADQTSYVEYYRWLTYLLLLILDLVICLVACLGLAKQSRWLLTTMMTFGVLTLILSWTSLGVDTATAVGTSDFCVAPDKFIMNLTRNAISTDIVHYYLYCSQSMPNPFQQALTIYQRSVTTMQIQIQGLLQFAVPMFPTAKRDLLGIQQMLNGSEASLHQLTALLDCRSLHKDYLDALIGVCYDGVEGLLYLSLFSLLAGTAFCAMLCAIPRAWRHFDNRDRDYDDIDEEDPFNPQARRIAAHNPVRGQIHSFCSYSSSMGSQSSLQPPAQAVSNAPVSEYMNQSVLFGGNPRYENVPLIGRGSPPPSPFKKKRYSPSMRATYLSVTDDQLRHSGSDLQV
ncbi:protein tweety homolog 2-like isoform X1 [Polyodon spathula]|uniref:protein tweety homolog 2-like isoform X1 n=1 Tax=Polyodon spathula TaxID=7913 RepID=UPI001B7DDCD2|nr:protein tweety homolog 2-like isoform X1 [Polyodon spathula]